MLSDDITYCSRKYADKIKRNTDLLLQQFGITYFTFQKVTNNGEWGLITGIPEWHAYSVDNLYYNYDPTLVHPENYKSGTCFTSSHSDKNAQVVLHDALTIFNLDNCLAIIEKNATGCEFAFFGTFPENKQIINAYVNKLHKLRAFVSFFKIALFRDSF